jgi:hypothetical protein
MGDISLDNQSSLLLQVSDDLAVGFLHIDTLVLGDLGGKSTSLVNRTRGNLVLGDDLVSETDSIIVLSPGWSLVNDTGTGLFGDIVVGQDSESSVLILIVSFQAGSSCSPTYLLSKVVKHGNVSPSNHILSLEASDLLELGLLLGVGLLSSGIFLVDGTEQLFEQDKVLSSLEIVDLDVGEVGVDTEGQVGSEGVRCSSPSEKRGGGIVDQGERDGDWSSAHASAHMSGTCQQDLWYLCNHHRPQSYSVGWYTPSSKA